MNSIWAICFLSWALMLPTLKNPIVGYAVGTSIAVIGLYIAFVLPIILRYRAKENFERGAWHLGNHYKWIDPLAIGWIVLICILFLLPLFPDGIPGNSAVVGIALPARTSTGSTSTTHRSRSAAPSSSSADGGCSRPRTGSRAPSGWAPRRSWSASRPASPRATESHAGAGRLRRARPQQLVPHRREVVEPGVVDALAVEVLRPACGGRSGGRRPSRRSGRSSRRRCRRPRGRRASRRRPSACTPRRRPGTARRGGSRRRRRRA